MDTCYGHLLKGHNLKKLHFLFIQVKIMFLKNIEHFQVISKNSEAVKAWYRRGDCHYNLKSWNDAIGTQIFEICRYLN